jgi:predicted nucleic acid-binding protein
MSDRRASTLFVADPPSSYLIQPPLIVDCSVVAGLIFAEHWRDEAQLRVSGRALHAPYLLQTEIVSVAYKKHRQGFAAIALDGLKMWGELGVCLHTTDPEQVLALSLQYELSAYDAAYLWLAADIKAPLATFDEKLGIAATEHLRKLA